MNRYQVLVLGILVLLISSFFIGCGNTTPAPIAQAPAEAQTSEPPTETPTSEPPTETLTSEPPTEAPTSEPPTETSTSEPPTETSTSELSTETPTSTIRSTPTLAPATLAAQELFIFDHRIKIAVWTLLTSNDLTQTAIDLRQLHEELEASETLSHPDIQEIKESGLQIIESLAKAAGNASTGNLKSVVLAMQSYRDAWKNFKLLAETPSKNTSINLGEGKLILTVFREDHQPASPEQAGGIPGMIPFVGGNPADDRWDIYVMNTDGTNLTNLTESEIPEKAPTWSPDGTQIAFQANFEIYVMNADGTGMEKLTDNEAYESDPVWSPDGTQILFVSDRDDNNEIYLMNADGTGATNLTNNEADDEHAAWSPDGKRIVFSSDRDGNSDIYVMNADGTEEATNLTNSESTIELNPTWSPDGKRIAYDGGDFDSNVRHGDIYVMNADGTGVTKLTNHPIPTVYDRNPVWSPDGDWILFTSNRFFSEDIFAVPADGTGVAIRFTDDAGDEVITDWIE